MRKTIRSFAERLYGSNRVEDFTKEQSDLMVTAAQRLVDRQQERYESTKNLVAEGIVPRASLMAMLEDLEFRRKALDLAKFRANLVEELVGAGARGRRS